MLFTLYDYDSESTEFVNLMHVDVAERMRDEARQALEEARDEYVRYANALHGPENELRYELSKRKLSVARGLLAEAEDCLYTYPEDYT